MPNNGGKINLLDLIDINLLQELQDTVANAMGVASIAVDENGPITKPSNFTDFCINLTRNTEEGYRRCNQCDIDWGKIAAKSGKPVIYDCHSGLTDFAVPIIVEGEHIASILGGQILTKKPDEEHFRQLARELGIDEESYIKALKKIKIVPKEKVDAAANFLFIVANTISKVAHKNVELIRKNEREKFFRKIIETIRSSLDLDETLSIICRETAKVFDVQRTAIASFPDANNFENFILKKEYTTSAEIELYNNTENAKKTAGTWGENLIKNSEILAINDIEASNMPDYFKTTYQQIGVKSIIGVAIKKGGDTWGTLTLADYEKTREWSEEEKETLKSIASQVYIAINQAELFEQAKIQADRERVISNIMSKAVSTFDINEIKQMVKEVGVITKADRCYFVEVDLENMKGKPIDFEGEYLASPDIKSIIGYEFPTEDVKGFVEIFLEKKDLTVFDYEEMFKDEGEEYAGPKKYARLFELKTGVGIPFYYMNKLTAVLAIEYVKVRTIQSEDELDFLRILGNQVGLAFRQIQNYKNTLKTAENEKVLNRILITGVESFEMKDIIQSIVSETGNLFKADRCFFIGYNEEAQCYRKIDRSDEYLSSEDISSHTQRAPRRDEVEIFTRLATPQQAIYSNNVEKENLPEITKNFLRELNVKSYLISPIYYAKRKYGALVLHYVNDFKEFTEEEIKLAIIIGNQSAVIMNRTELYEITKIQAEREKISKNIIEILRSSMDKTIIKKLFVKSLGKFFNANRVIFSEYDLNNKKYLPVDSDSEYLSSANETSRIGYDWSKAEATEYIEPLLEKRELKISSFDEYIQQNIKRKEFIDLFVSSNVKSSYSFPVLYQERIMGFFSIEFTQQEVKLNDEDINRIRNICTQAGIALYHSSLYLEAQKSIQAHANFVNKLSNELKEPLNLIVEFSDTLSHEKLQRNDELKHLNNINDCAKKLLYLLDDIKDKASMKNY